MRCATGEPIRGNRHVAVAQPQCLFEKTDGTVGQNLNPTPFSAISVSLTLVNCISAQECLETVRIRRLRLPLRHSTSAFRLIFVIAAVGVALVAALPVSAAPNSDVSSKRAQAEAARAQLAELGAQLEPAIERYNKAVVELKQVDADIAFNKKQIAVTTIVPPTSISMPPDLGTSEVAGPRSSTCPTE